MTSTFFPAVHSVLSAAALARLVQQQYAGQDDVQLRFLRRGINDTYLLTGLAGHPHAILRVYRAGWRTPADLDWELSLTASLNTVARPLPALNGQLYGELSAIEGTRPYAVFEFVEGRMPERTAGDAALYGRTLANLHQASAAFPAGGRFSLDLAHLLTEPLNAIRTQLPDDPQTLNSLEELAARTHTRLSALTPELRWGACHGDPHDANARIDQGTLRLFDFDCGGPGWPAYDLAVYWWDHALNDTPEELATVWPAFLNAYEDVRPLTAAERKALPFFVLARSFWFMGLFAGRVWVNGSESLHPEFFRRGLNFVQDWWEEHA
ncbi:hypothetical protein D3875_14080 [Deinococcus cavernae]|uniref:Aminoglycoside phosphotransferase domain-containing protein n=1 Tax=Deinococcus cavernae TaxID=2320857 RepID=A0A418V8Y4_9DEIO|nr:phosphotransferase [Deinococcus cavernae]RJF72512.1 hypothetical protein D3875_14080 [Deinococcus cavernae]